MKSIFNKENKYWSKILEWQQILLWCNIQIRKYLLPCHIITLASIFKRVLGGWVKSDRVNAEVCSDINVTIKTPTSEKVELFLSPVENGANLLNTWSVHEFAQEV